MPITTVTIEYTPSEDRWEVRYFTDPVPASRPRVGKFGTYYPKTYANWKKAGEDACEKVPGKSITEEPLFVLVDVVVERPKKPANEYPHPDVDNYAKAALDLITKGGLIWKDDKQVVTLYSTKRYAEKDERPHIFVGATILRDVSDGEDVYDLPDEDRVSLETVDITRGLFTEED